MMSDASEGNPEDPPDRVHVLNRQRRFKICGMSVASFCDALLRTLGQPAQTLSVVFVSARRMRRINHQYLGRDYATDVLSFSYERVIAEGSPFLGEIIIAPEIALEQAVRYRADPEREVRKLLVHGVLHLLGYNHETDQGRMNRVQAGLTRRKFFAESPALADLRVRR